MNKLAEQLSNDIAVRAAQKLAALVDDNGMEKEAGAVSEGVKNLAKGEALGKLKSILPFMGAGAGIGGIGGLANTYMNSTDENPASIGDYLKGGLSGAAVGSLGGAAVGGVAPEMKGALKKYMNADKLENLVNEAYEAGDMATANLGIKDLINKAFSDPAYASRFGQLG